MRKLMKVISIILLALVGIGLSVLAFFFMTHPGVEVLDSQSQEKLKEGRQFWLWERSADQNAEGQGSLAMHFVEKGEGDRHLIFIHGFRSHSFTWEAIVDPLARAGYHTWAIDLIGYGLSDKPDLDIYDVDFFVEQLHRFMKSQGISKAHLIGNSMGGGVALSTAVAYPQDVASLILISPLGYPLDLPFYLSIGKMLGKWWAPFFSPSLIRYGLEKIVYHKDRITDQQVEAYTLPYYFPGGINASLLTLQRFDNQQLVQLSRNYPSFRFPTLLIWGVCDPLIPVSHFDLFVRDFPHADTLLIPQCGHLPQEEEPQLVTQAILQFLDKNRD